MSDDKMRAEFEKWATPYGLDLRRLNEGYLSNASNNCWIVWQAAYQAGQTAEREAIATEVQSFAEQNGYPWKVRMAFIAAAATIRKRPKGEQ